MPTVFNAFPKIMLPATILSELFEGRRRIQHIQKSRIKRAAELEQTIARGRLKVVRATDPVRDDLSKEVGDSLGGFIRAAETANGVVLRPAPVHKPGLEQINADVAAYTQALSDMQTLLAVLVDHGAVDQAKEETAKRYFDLQDQKWPSPARPDPDRPLFIDGLAVIYLQYTDLLDTVLDMFKDVRIEAEAQDEVLLIIDHNRHVTEVLATIDAIRTAIRDANATGKVVFGPRRVKREEVDDGDGISLSTLHLLTNLSGADAVVCDDRALNKEAFAQDTSGKRVRVLTTLDIIEELKQRVLISENERRSLRHRLRASGAVSVPADTSEIASAAVRSGAMKSAEFQAIEESIDLACLAEVPAFPREMPWFANFNMAAKAAILEVWKTESDRQRAAMISDIVLGLVPNPEDWISQWGRNPPPEWVHAVRSISIASLAMPVELADDQSSAAYNDWLEGRLLEPLRAMEPELYRSVTAYLRTFIESATEDDDEQAPNLPRLRALYALSKLSDALSSDVLADGSIAERFDITVGRPVQLSNGAVISQTVLFKAFREALAGQPIGPLLDQDGKTLVAEVSIDADGSGLVKVGRKGFRFENARLLTPDAAKRVEFFDNILERHTLSEGEAEKARARLQVAFFG